MKKSNRTISKVFAIVCAVLIPVLFILYAFQADRYTKLEKEVRELEQKQVLLVEQNKRLVTDISLLSSAERIGQIAKEEYGMHEAESEEIVRLEMKKKK